MRHRVAVYGTLRPSTNGKYIDATHILHGFAMYNYYDKFPYIKESEGDMVFVNVLEVDDKGLDGLDRYEGVDKGLYDRMMVSIATLDGRDAGQAWVYVAGDIAPEKIDSGDWAKEQEGDE